MKFDQMPTSAQVEQELQRERYKLRYRRTLKSTIFTLLTAAAAAVLVATLWLPVLQIYGSSMSPTLSEGEIVLSWKSADFEQGDIVAFYYGNSLLIKRYIAGPGSWIDIQEDGTVLVDGEVLDEPYLTEKAFGSCDIELPYQVPEGRYFLLGDHRATSVDSRHTAVGCIAKEQIVGKVMYRVWPLSAFGTVQ
ncbi:MAG: signal peptidase I [Oscillospiraceae bacterium]|nr:signal peptidase I [Oscillospiraceae bacterium]